MTMKAFVLKARNLPLKAILQDSSNLSKMTVYLREYQSFENVQTEPEAQVVGPVQPWPPPGNVNLVGPKRFSVNPYIDPKLEIAPRRVAAAPRSPL